MKTTLKLLALSLIVFLSACSTSNMTVLKRKYNPGYYVDLGIRKNQSVLSSNRSDLKTSSKAKINNDVCIDKPSYVSVVKEENGNNNSLTASNDHRIYASSTTKKESLKNFSDIVASGTQGKTPAKISKFKKIVMTSINKKTKKDGGDVDDRTVLLVILSLFPILALVAIWMKDGKTITANFWVDLVLHFVFLYWLFALLVVLDVINLA